MYFLLSMFPLAAVCTLTISVSFVSGPRTAQLQPQVSEPPRAIVESVSHDFGSAEQGTRLVHQFTIRNAGTSALTVTRLALSVRGMTAKVKPTILPGKEETLTVEWDT